VRSIMEQDIQLSSTTLTREIALSILAQHPKWIVLQDDNLLVNPSDLANYVSSPTIQADALIDLLVIPAQRLDLIELSEDTTLYQAITSMNHASVDAAYIPNSRRLGIITREQIDNFYKI
jgi:chloride channel protein, CIC family